jgi:hypothetical protein
MAFGQAWRTLTTGKASTSAPCSLANTGSGNNIKITCNGIGAKQGGEILGLLNKIYTSEMDVSVVLEKLDEILQRTANRRVSDDQAEAFVSALCAVPNSKIKVGCTVGGGDESLLFLRQLMPLFIRAGWTLEDAITSHMEIQITGVGLLSRGGAQATQPSYIRLTATMEALRNAFRAAGIELQFINYHASTDNLLELVIG